MSASPTPPETPSHLPAQLRSGYRLGAAYGSGSSGEDSDNTFELMFPGDDGWAEHQWRMAKRRADHLSNHGWKFWKSEGPRGTYYEGFGPSGRRVMTEQKEDPRAAFLAAITHAFEVQFPSP